MPPRGDEPLLAQRFFHRIGGLLVTPKLQRHEGDSYGYRVEAHEKCFVYSTDSEHRVDDAEERQSFVEFFRGADLVVFDAMYALADAISVKADWGHSSNIMGVELCQAARTRAVGALRYQAFKYLARTRSGE